MSIGDALPAPVATERTIEGQVVPWNQWLEVDNPREGHFIERFLPGSLRKSFGLLRRLKGYMEHGKTRTFERAPVMQVLDAWETGTGAFFQATLLDGIPPFIVDGIRRGLYGASLGAEPIEVERTRFPGRSAHNPKGLEERTYRELRAFDISLTASPAYESAMVTLRANDYLADYSNAIFRVGIEPVHFLAGPSRRPRDYFADIPPYRPRDYLADPPDYFADPELKDDWRL